MKFCEFGPCMSRVTVEFPLTDDSNKVVYVILACHEHLSRAIADTEEEVSHDYKSSS